MADKKAFLLYHDYIEHFELLTREERGDLITLILLYVNKRDLDLENYSGSVKMAFSFIKADIERNADKYDKTCHNRAEAAKAREEKKKQAQQTTKSTIVQSVYNCDDTDTETDTVTDTETKTDTDTVTDTETKTDTDTETETDNNIVLPSGELGADAPALQHTKKKSTRFIPPTVEEVRDYCKEINKYIDAERFVDYYTANGWKVGRNAMRDWQATVRNWCKNDKSGGTFVDEGHDLDGVFGGS